MSLALAALENERNGILAEVRNIAAKAEEAGRGFTEDEQATVTERLAKAADVNDQIKRFKNVAATTSQIDEMMAGEDAAELNEKALAGARLGFKGIKGLPSNADLFIKSDAYKALMQQHGGKLIPESAKNINSGAVQLGGFKSLLTGANRTDGAGVLVAPDSLGVVEYRAPYIGGIRDLVTVGSTDSDKVEFAQAIPDEVDPAKTASGAQGVYEAETEAKIGSGTPAVTNKRAGLKPQAKMSFQKKSVDVITVAHWLPATKRALSDAKQLRTLIDGFLRSGVSRKFEQLMLAGDRDNPLDPNYEEFDGLLNMTGVQNQAWDRNILRTARKMITKVENKGGQFTAFAVSPAVNEAIDLLQDRDGRFLSGGPFSGGPKTLWGHARVTVPDLEDDIILGGEWSSLVLWDREDTTLTATDSHEDYFTRNLVAVLAEARAAFGSFNPQLMCVGAVDDPEAPVYEDEAA